MGSVELNYKHIRASWELRLWLSGKALALIIKALRLIANATGKQNKPSICILTISEMVVWSYTPITPTLV